MFCNHCGKQIPEQSTFCTYCGNKQSAPTPSNKENHKTGKIACPKCEKDDQIQNVYTIYTNGNTSTQLDYRTATSTTQLASRLSPPTNPMKMAGGCAWSLVFTFFVVVIAGLMYWLFQTDGTIIALIGGGIITWIAYRSDVKRFNNYKADWEKKIKIYFELYYCYRDDCVFNPKTSKYTSPEGMSRLF